MSTSFVQFERCDLCRQNHVQGRKHVYSKRHKEILTNILKKFKQKVKLALQDMYLPHIEDANWEATAKFWCYFCRVEAEKHEIVDNVTIRNSGILQHLSKSDHRIYMEQFWTENKIKDKKMDIYLLNEKDIERFHIRAEAAIQKYLLKIRGEKSKIAVKLQKQAEIRRQIMQNVRQQVQLQMTNAATLASRKGDDYSSHSNMDGPGPPVKKLKIDPGPVRTIAAHGKGLTCISLQGEKTKLKGNVHSGATPPWLRHDLDQTGLNPIGPKLEDYEKYLEGERKRKLPAIRVGAHFDHKVETDIKWLPSFGRVWNNQRRINSRQQFERSDWKMNSHQSESLNEIIRIEPYIKKGRRVATATVSSPPADQETQDNSMQWQVGSGEQESGHFPITFKTEHKDSVSMTPRHSESVDWMAQGQHNSKTGNDWLSRGQQHSERGNDWLSQGQQHSEMGDDWLSQGQWNIEQGYQEYSKPPSTTGSKGEYSQGYPEYQIDSFGYQHYSHGKESSNVSSEYSHDKYLNENAGGRSNYSRVQSDNHNTYFSHGYPSGNSVHQSDEYSHKLPSHKQDRYLQHQSGFSNVSSRNVVSKVSVAESKSHFHFKPYLKKTVKKSGPLPDYDINMQPVMAQQEQYSAEYDIVSAYEKNYNNISTSQNQNSTVRNHSDDFNQSGSRFQQSNIIGQSEQLSSEVALHQPTDLENSTYVPSYKRQSNVKKIKISSKFLK